MSKVAAFLGEGLRRPSTASSPTRERKDSILRASPPLTLEPSMEGPPSPRTIRAYTENMKSGSHGRTRTNSTVSSFGGSESGHHSGPHSPEPTLRRQTSKKSISGMSTKAERPDSISMFGKSLFSRGSRKSKATIGRARASSSLSLHPREMPFSASTTTIDEEQSFKKHLISGPYNFQHVTHTGQDHAAPGDEVKSRKSSIDEFNSLHGPLNPHPGNEIYVPDDDEVDNSSIDPFNSFDSIHTIREHAIPPPLPTQHHIPRKHVNPVNTQRPTLRTSQSHDSVRNAHGPPPPRPPRSPMTQGPSLPPRTSSRNGSQIWDEYDPLMTTSLERPHYASGFRRPQAFHLPLSPPLPSTQVEDGDYFQQPLVSPRQQDPGWPFVSPAPSATSGGESQLADVPEEEPINFSRRQNRMSTASIRASRSVPNLMKPHENWPDMPQMPSEPVRLTLDNFENWEDDIDYCYENEVEANCDYDWLERASLETEREHNPFHDSGVSVSEGIAMTDSGPTSPISPKAPKDRRHPPVSMHTVKNSMGRRLEAALQLDLANNMAAVETHVTPPTAIEQEKEVDFPQSDDIKQTNLLRPDSFQFTNGDGFPHSPSLLLPLDYSKELSLSDFENNNSRLSIDINSFVYDHHTSFPMVMDFMGNSNQNRLSAPNRPDSTSTATHSYRSSADVDVLRSSGDSSTSLATSVDELKEQKSFESMVSSSVGREHSGSVSSVVSINSNPFSTYIEPSAAPAAVLPIRSSLEADDVLSFPLPPHTGSASPPLPPPTTEAEEPLSLELARQEAETRLLPPSPSPCAQEEGKMSDAMASRHGRKGSVPLTSGHMKSGSVVKDLPVMKEQSAVSAMKKMGRARSSTVGARTKSAYGLFPSAAPANPNPGAPF